MDEAGPGHLPAAKLPWLHHPLSGPIPRNRVKTVPRGSGFDLDTVLLLDVLGSAASPVSRHVGSRHCHSNPQLVSLSYYYTKVSRFLLHSLMAYLELSDSGSVPELARDMRTSKYVID